MQIEWPVFLPVFVDHFKFYIEAALCRPPINPEHPDEHFISNINSRTIQGNCYITNPSTDKNSIDYFKTSRINHIHFSAFIDKSKCIDAIGRQSNINNIPTDRNESHNTLASQV